MRAKGPWDACRAHGISDESLTGVQTWLMTHYLLSAPRQQFLPAPLWLESQPESNVSSLPALYRNWENYCVNYIRIHLCLSKTMLFA